MRSSPAAFAQDFAINDHLHVAGWEGTHGLLWIGGEVQSLAEGDCITHSPPVAINRSGQMVGHGGGCTSQHTLILRGGRAEILGAGTSGGGGTAINDRGFAVGFGDGRGSSPTWGSIYSPESERADQGTLYPNPSPVENWYGSGGKLERTLPSDLNEKNHVVGTATIPSGEGHGFLWRDGRITDLSPLVNGWIVTTALRIDEQGRILATARRNSGSSPLPVLLITRWRVRWQQGRARQALPRSRRRRSCRREGDVAGSRLPAFRACTELASAPSSFVSRVAGYSEV